MTSSRTYVIGHKNPDSDSICSAIAYARLREAQGMEGVQPARAGTLNRQTEFVLEELAVNPPQLLTDVHPRVCDVLSPSLVTVPPDAPLSRALELFHLHNIRTLPVVDAERHPLGMLYLKQLSERFLVPRQASEIRKVRASLNAIATCLQGSLLNAQGADRIEDLHLYVGAMDSATFKDRMRERDDVRQTVLITGDRRKILGQAVELGVRLLVVTGDLPIPEEVAAMARENDVSILTTGFDTATATWLARLSTPVECLLGDTFPTIGERERLEDLRLKLTHSEVPGVIVLDGDKRVVGVATKSNLLQPSPIKLILVDHNELSQSVSGADRVEILEVVDHHRLGNFHTDQPIRFINQPLGSTCSVVATLYRQARLTPDRATAALMLAGLLSDTVILKSPTTTDIDRELATWLSDLSGYGVQEFGQRIFAAGSSLGAYPTTRDLVLADFKEFTVDEEKIGIGQVEVVNFTEFYDLKKAIHEALQELKKQRDLMMIGLLVTDIVKETSLFLALGNKDLPYRMAYPQLEENLYELKGVLSRKKQLAPHLLKALKN